MATAIPVIDLADWLDGTDEARARAAAAWVSACLDPGFAYVVHHGVPWSQVTSLFGTARELFGLPADDLDAIHYRHGRRFRGFVPVGDPYAPPCTKENFDCGLPIDGYAGPGDELATCPNLWPAQLPAVERDLEIYLARLRGLGEQLFAMLAVGFGRRPDHFAAIVDRPVVTLRLLHYPVHDGELSVGTHTDYEALTILAQDDVGGLQIRPRGSSWIDVPPVPEAFVVSIGEMATGWTNGRLRATDHRVLAPQGSDRYSVAFFFAPNYDAIVAPLADPLDGEAPSEPVATGDYLQHRLLEEHA